MERWKSEDGCVWFDGVRVITTSWPIHYGYSTPERFVELLNQVTITPEEHARRMAAHTPDPRIEMCGNCGHSHEDHDPESMGGQCWNGSGLGNKCSCNNYEREQGGADAKRSAL